MARLLFEKTGAAVWISHLDLMRLFQRAFKRTGLPLKHTQGYNPRPAVSIALPLSVGVESVCELLDFELDGDLPSMDEIKARLNRSLVAGVNVLSVYHDGKKIRDLSLLRCRVSLEYDRGFGVNAVEDIRALYSCGSLLVAKKSKNGPVEQDIIPLIRHLDVDAVSTQEIVIDAVICCQNPSLNPMQLAAAVEKYLPEHRPDHFVCCRVEIMDNNENVFR